MNDKKRSLGQFFTKNHFRLKDHIVDFISSIFATTALDPFAGNGDLLLVAQELGFQNIQGFDIDDFLPWEFNDSLKKIPNIPNSFIITNPPYLTNYSASRKHIYDNVKQYFETCKYDDLYQLAIEKCMESNEYGVMIIPETFINTSFPKNRLHSITIIEDLLFNDTENPICVICFDPQYKSLNDVKVYKNEEFIGHLGNLEKLRKQPRKHISIKFNALNGNIALRAIDTTRANKGIQFMKPEELDYDLSNIKVSSRLITLIDLQLEQQLIDPLIDQCNEILYEFRAKTNDVLLSPFKGNKKNGKRRRRLDYLTARAIIEEAYETLCPRLTLF